MYYYFKLQYTMFNRRMSDFGIHPILGYIGILIVYYLGSNILFLKTSYASYIYTFLAVYFVAELSEVHRNELLKSCFSKIDYLKIRCLENIVLLIPFILFLCIKSAWVFALILFIIGGFLGLMNFRKEVHLTLPTPFYKYPFEYLVGFRKTILVLLFAYFLTIMAAIVGNFNLGLFSFIIVFIIALSFYSKSENQYYTWIYALKPKEFLGYKIKIAVLYLLLMSTPILLVLFIVFPTSIHIVVIAFLIASLYLVTYILAKYAAFPDAINLPLFILYAMAFIFPPFLLGVIPFFYKQSIKRLNYILL